jgi:hypothetical protein
MAQLHLVVDTKGAGRVVGVFHDPARIVAIDPNYFRLIELETDTINPAAVEWLPAPKPELLRGA